jgi:oxaloacetate decarboxylase alpha subunit
MEKKIIKITDTTLRDAHQSLWATRMRTEDILPIAETIDKIGYHSVEVWGGATFDVALRYLDEDPWERLKLLHNHIKTTPLQMLLRGQNIVGYKNYPDDVLEAFIIKSIEHGVKIFRIFDALDDVRNLEKAIKVVKANGAHAQGNICYTISPVHTIERYVACAKEQYNLGIDSLNIKDMAGILAPKTAYDLIKALKSELKGIPIQLHCHSSSGMATATYLKAIEAGVDIIDCAVAPLALYTSQPAVESIIAILSDLGYEHNLRLDLIEEVAEYFEGIAEKRSLQRKKQSMIDTSVIIHQIPGGMASNLIVQLEEQNALDKLEDVLREVPRVREELGFPPLVTPTSQIVGIQAVFNVLYGRYKIIPQETRDYVKGYYGRPPAPISKEIQKIVLGEDKPITCRPADLLPSGLEEAKAKLPKKYIQKEEDIISFALFPKQALDFFKKRHEGKLTKKREEETEAFREKELTAISTSSLTTTGKDEKITEATIKEVVEIAESWGLQEIEISKGTARIKIKKAQSASCVSKESTSAVTTLSKDKENNYHKIVAPLKGTFYRRPSPDAPPYVEVSDYIKPNQTLALIEAMKLFNEIKSDVEGRVHRILIEDGTKVEKGQELFLIEKIG